MARAVRDVSEAAGREMMRSVDRWMRAPVVWFGIDHGFSERGAVGYVSRAGGVFEYKTRRITKMECTVSIKADDTTTITTPNGQRVTLKQAAECADRVCEVATRLCGYPRQAYEPLINAHTLANAVGNLGVLQRERDDARREARQAKAEAEEATKAAERARAGVIATNEENRRLRGDLIAAREQLEKLVCSTPYGRAPALTLDTPVTLGMLRDLSGESSRLNDERWERERPRHRPTVLEKYGTTPMQEVIDGRLRK